MSRRTATALQGLTIEIEVGNPGDPDAAAAALSGALRESLGLHVEVRIVQPGTLPRFDMKARRFVISDQ